MLNTVYRLVAPYRIEVEFSNADLGDEDVLVRPTYLSICHADQRYYQGQRSQNVLTEKLPMALIHEGIGSVIYDRSGKLKPGTRVVMIPNTPSETDDIISENYLRSSRFRASGFDGFMQEYVVMHADRIVPLPEHIDNEVAAFTELMTVSAQAIRRFDRIAHRRRKQIGVWGDGNLGYLTALLLKFTFPETKVFVFGVNETKLCDFTFADAAFLVNDVPKDLSVDHAFECVGGQSAPAAIEQIIDRIRPEGTISLLGVSEYAVPVNTRMVLEKGLQVFGTSRSAREDFLHVIGLLAEEPDLLDYLRPLVGRVFEIRTIEDMKRAFEWDMQKAGGKTIMKWMK